MTRKTPCETLNTTSIVQLIEQWSSHTGVSASALLDHAGLSRSSMTWWRYGVKPSRGTLRLIELAMADLARKLRRKQKKTSV